MRGYLAVSHSIRDNFFDPLLPIGLQYDLYRLRTVHPELDHGPVRLLDPAVLLDLGVDMYVVSEFSYS